jgi:uncharacterized membrane protein YccC
MNAKFGTGAVAPRGLPQTAPDRSHTPPRGQATDLPRTPRHADLVPAPPKWFSPLIAMRPGWAFGPAITAVSAMAGVFLTVGLILGPPEAALALAGSMAVLFVRGEPYPRRIAGVTIIGLTILVLSALASATVDQPVALLAVLTVGAFVAAAITESLAAPIPGPTILLVAATIAAAVPSQAIPEFGTRLALLALGTLVALVTAMSPWAWRRHAPEQHAVVQSLQATISAVTAIGTPRYEKARSAAWASTVRAERALHLSKNVPGREQSRTAQLQTASAAIVPLLSAAELANRAFAPVTDQTLATLKSVVQYLTNDKHTPTITASDGADQSLRTHTPGGSTLEAIEKIAANLLASVSTSTDDGAARSRLARTAADTHPMPKWQTTMSRYGLTYPTRLAAATLLAGSLALGLGIDRWYWTPVCAVATIWGSDHRLTWHRAVQRAVATVAGCAVGVGLTMFDAPFTIVAITVALLLLAAELLFPRNYGFAMAPISAMIVLIIDTSSPFPVDDFAVALDRVTAATLGSAVGLIAVLGLWPASATNQIQRRITESRSLQSILRTSMESPLIRPSAEILHRRLIDDLIDIEAVAQAALGESRKRLLATESYLSTRALVSDGYLLAAQLGTPAAAGSNTPDLSQLRDQLRAWGDPLYSTEVEPK